jgi:hypothetical protein
VGCAIFWAVFSETRLVTLKAAYCAFNSKFESSLFSKTKFTLVSQRTYSASTKKKVPMYRTILHLLRCQKIWSHSFEEFAPSLHFLAKQNPKVKIYPAFLSFLANCNWLKRLFTPLSRCLLVHVVKNWPQALEGSSPETAVFLMQSPETAFFSTQNTNFLSTMFFEHELFGVQTFLSMNFVGCEVFWIRTF